MRNMFHKFLALALVACMLCSFGVLSASAAAPYADGRYTANVTFLHDSKDQPSMCNVLFDHDADIVVKDGTASISLYPANPVPAFPDQGADGTVKDVVMTLDGVQYPATSDITTKPLREMDETNPAFGVEQGKSLPTQIVTFSFPAEKLDVLAGTPAEVSAYVNVVMMTNVVFRLKVENITAVPDETSRQSMQITAQIEAPKPTYAVTIPETINMGTLSRESNTSQAYVVEVTADNLGSGRVVVSAPKAGELTSGDNTLAYTNTFGTQETSVSAELKGAFEVTASNVAAAAAGNYTGTANFAIAYYAGK